MSDQISSMNNVKNLALRAAYEAEGIGSNYSYNSLRPQNYKPLNPHTHGSMGFFPLYFMAKGLTLNNETKVEFYPLAQFPTADEARLKFQQTYYAAGLRGVTVTPLYDLNRFH